MASESETSFDLMIIGGGLAGLVAAARAVELGIKPVVLEQGVSEKYRCNSRSSGGIFHVSYHDVKLEPAKLRDAIRSATKGEARDDLAQAIADNAGRAIDWLSHHGTKFIRASMVDWHRWTVAPPRPLRPGLDFPGFGVDTIMTRLTAFIKAGGGTVALGHRATAITRHGELLHVACERAANENATFAAPAVVLADGGFQANPEMLREHVTVAPERLLQRGAATGKGDCARMAMELGASLTRCDRFYGHPLHRDALTNDKLWPYPQMDSLALASMVVGPDACRFMDEGRGGLVLANAIAKMGDPASSILIFDESIWEGPGRESLYPANPHVEKNGGEIFSADTIDELARKLDIDARQLAATVAAYNAFLERGAGDSLVPARTGRLAVPLRPPFMAIPMCAGITHTMGGLAINGRMQVLDREGMPLPGLFAIGGTTGGLEGGDAVGYVGGLVKALSMGLLAAEAISPAVRPQAAALRRSDPIAPRKTPTYAFLRFAARHGRLLGGVAIGVATASAAAAAATVGLGWALVTVVIGILAYLVLNVLVDIANVICDVLLPGE